jgi:hypothetical protein
MTSLLDELSDDIEQIARSYLKNMRESGRSNVSSSAPPASPADCPEGVWNEMTRAQQ